MRTKTAMNEQGLKYFSALTPKQKDKSVLYVCGYIANDLTEPLLPIYRQMYNPDLTGCKMFYHKNLKVWFPINIKDFIKNNQV